MHGIEIRMATADVLDEVADLSQALARGTEGHCPDVWTIRRSLTELVSAAEFPFLIASDRFGVCRGFSLGAGMEVSEWKGGTWQQLTSLHVDSRRNGIGSQLLAAFEEECRRRGRCGVQVLCDKNNPCRPFYERHGYQLSNYLLYRKHL